VVCLQQVSRRSAISPLSRWHAGVTCRESSISSVHFDQQWHSCTHLSATRQPCIGHSFKRGDDMRQVKRQRQYPDEAPPTAAPAYASRPSASSAASAARATPAAATAQSYSTVERGDSDEFLSSAIDELHGDDFLLSPQKVTVADINSVAGAC
jgi:hypothetical protein